jgi:phosphate transport system protein
MGSLAESMVAQAVDSLVNLDTAMAMRVVLSDDEIDDRDVEIEAWCLKLLSLQNPTGADLRTVGTAIKIITDLERIGDLAVDIAKAGMKIEKEFGSPNIIDVPKIAAECSSMLRLTLQAFVRRDLDLVNEVIEKDDVVDQLYRDLRDQIHAHMREEPDAVVSDSWLLLAIHHLERVADHTVNIAERISFMVTGQFVQLKQSHKSPSGDPETP